MTESMDPYLYPGTNVLRNLRDIRNPGILACFEAEATAHRIVETRDVQKVRSLPRV